MEFAYYGNSNVKGMVNDITEEVWSAHDSQIWPLIIMVYVATTFCEDFLSMD